MACYERPAAWAAKTSFPNKRLPAAQSFYEQLTSGGGQDYNASDATQKAIVDAAKRTRLPVQVTAPHGYRTSTRTQDFPAPVGMPVANT